MNTLEKIKYTLNKMMLFTGKSGKYWMLTCLISSLVIVAVEYLIAGFLQVFIVIIGLVDKDKVPTFLSDFADLGIPYLLIVLISVGFLRAFGLFLQLFTLNIVREITLTNLRGFTAFSLLKLRDDKRITGGEALEHISDSFMKSGYFVQQITITTAMIIQSGLLFLSAFYFAPYEASISIFGIIIVFALLKIISRLVTKYAGNIPEKNSIIINSLNNSIKNIIFLTISRKHNEELDKINNNLSDYLKFSKKAYFYGSIGPTFPQFLGILLIAGILLISFNYFDTESSHLLAFLYFFTRFTMSAGLCSSNFSQALVFLPQFLSSSKLIDKHSPEQITQGFKSINQNKQNKKRIDIEALNSASSPTIDIKSLAHQYENKYIFDGINLKIQAGSIVGIVGESGSGKSTLLNSMLGIIKPTKGTVKINDSSAIQYIDDFHNIIGYVGPEPFILPGTITDNLHYGSYKKYSHQECWDMLNSVLLKETIKSKPKELKFELSEIGEGLSSGQKQRLSIARALLKKPKLLILDEATANLDNETEEHILQIFQNLKGKCTIVIVSHRENALKICDSVFNMKNLTNMPSTT